MRNQAEEVLAEPPPDNWWADAGEPLRGGVMDIIAAGPAPEPQPVEPAQPNRQQRRAAIWGRPRPLNEENEEQ